MIEISLERESVKGLFGEDINVVSILEWKDDIILLGGNGKFGGQSGLLNVFIVE